MKFSDVVKQAVVLLRESGRLTYRTLKREFELSDEALEDLKFELIEGQELAVDKDGKMLVWKGTPSEQPGRETERTKTEVSPPRGALPAEAERRQLTVMFCDVVGSTALSTQLDPEELREVVRAYQQTCAQVISRFEGHLAKYLGDGLLVYFGYPVAHEDDAQRAVRAGLGIIEALREMLLLNLRQPHPLQVRIGIHTGLVVAGEMGGGDTREPFAIVGETPNVAARLQEIATPNTMVVSTVTYHLIQGYFACRELGLYTLKGIPTPVPVYQVLRESGTQSRFELAVSIGLTSLVGREQEVGFLLERWKRAKAGEGQLILLSGEPGIGKSRLVQVVKEHVAAEGATRIEFRCSPYYQHSALYPVIEHLQRLLQFEREDPPQDKLEKLTQVLARYSFPRADTLPLLAALLSLPHPPGAPPLTGSPQKQKEKLQAALVAWLVEEAEQAAVYCTWEDLHWADPSTLEVLTLLLDQVPATRLLALLTFRPEFIPPWGNRSHLSRLTLGRLGRWEVEAMVERVTEGKALPPEVMQQVVAKTDGVPLFVEELTKTVIESGLLAAADGRYELRGPLPPLAIPSTLHDSLMARLDRLAAVREIAQLGATLGREFSYELLQAVSSLDEQTLQQGLKQLVEAELVYQRGLPPQAHYHFKHALIRDTAYQSLLKSTRQQLHQQIAQVLTDRFPQTVETQPELLAHHYTEAGLLTPAVAQWQAAGQRAMQRSANTEAIRHLTTGLALLRTLPAAPEHIEQELMLQITLGLVLMSVKGWGAPEVEQAYTRARDLCHHLGETPQLFPVLWGLWAFYLVRGELHDAVNLGHQLLGLAQRQHDSLLRIGCHYALGVAQFFLGQFIPALEQMEQCAALYDPQQHLHAVALYGVDPGAFGLGYGAHILWVLGYPDQALTRCDALLALSQEFTQPYSRMYASFHAAVHHQFRGDVGGTLEHAERTMAVSEEQGFGMEWGIGALTRGWAIAEQGREEEGLTESRRGNEAWQSTGANLTWTWRASVLAAMYRKVRQSEKGLKEVGEALAMMGGKPERLCVAELYRLKGEIMLQSSTYSPQSAVKQDAEECFLQALELARRQQAKSWELRAAMSLSRLWQQQGKKDEARQILAEIYGWFTEGFDTKDLQEAKTLLDELL